MRIVQAGVEREQLLVEIENADEVDLELDERGLLVGQRHLQHAENRDVAGRNFEDDAKRKRDQRTAFPSRAWPSDR